LRQKIHAIKSQIYTQTQEAVQKRWVYEAEIKRPYFHIKPLDETQLSNWRKYLEFEEGEGDVARCYVLYERCMVACALYEEFWLKYVRYLQSKQDVEGTRNVFLRAASVYLPAG
jgi:pre-mRNA-processing factor 39